MHRGNADSGIWVTTFDGTTWSTDARIGVLATAAGAAAAVNNNTLYLAYRGDTTDTDLRYVTYDGTTWGPETKIPGAASTLTSNAEVNWMSDPMTAAKAFNEAGNGVNRLLVSKAKRSQSRPNRKIKALES